MGNVQEETVATTFWKLSTRGKNLQSKLALGQAGHQPDFQHRAEGPKPPTLAALGQ